MRGFLTGCRGGSRRFGGRGKPVHRYDEHVDCVVSAKVGELECVPWCYVWKERCQHFEKEGIEVKRKKEGSPIKSLGLRSV